MQLPSFYLLRGSSTLFEHLIIEGGNRYHVFCNSGIVAVKKKCERVGMGPAQVNCKKCQKRIEELKKWWEKRLMDDLQSGPAKLEPSA